VLNTRNFLNPPERSSECYVFCKTNEGITFLSLLPISNISSLCELLDRGKSFCVVPSNAMMSRQSNVAEIVLSRSYRSCFPQPGDRFASHHMSLSDLYHLFLNPRLQCRHITELWVGQREELESLLQPLCKFPSRRAKSFIDGSHRCIVICHTYPSFDGT